MATPFHPYSSPTNNSDKVPIKLVPNLYARGASVAPLSQADLQARTRPIAIVANAVREAQVFIQEARAHIKQAERDVTLVLADYEEFGRRWKEFGPTKNLAYQAVYDAAPHVIRQRIYRLRENLDKSCLTDEDVQPSPKSEGSTASQDKQNSLAKIAALPDPKEEPEKPHIRTKDEIEAEQAEQAKPAPRKAVTENGKPKSQLAVWDKAQSIGGAYERAIDDINRLCPNKAFHDRIISTIQDAMSSTRQWRGTVK